LYDYYHGLEDIKHKIVRAVGNPDDRFKQDPLRMLRAIRFACKLGFSIEHQTKLSIFNNSKIINKISQERIRVELNEILLSDYPVYGFELLLELGLLQHIIPELMECVDFDQRSVWHDKNVFDHIMAVVFNTPPKLDVRLSALFHDIGKPKAFTLGEDGHGHFKKHQIYSADMTKEILTRLKYDNKTIDKVTILVHEHMSRYAKLRTTNIKKFINRVGIENLDDLFELQIADIKGSKPPFDFSEVEEF
jgi:tRNA nucleotidyltransferase (CCA-adding enzyme)